MARIRFVAERGPDGERETRGTGRPRILRWITPEFGGRRDARGDDGSWPAIRAISLCTIRRSHRRQASRYFLCAGASRSNPFGEVRSFLATKGILSGEPARAFAPAQAYATGF